MKLVLILDDDKRRVRRFCDRLCRKDWSVVWAHNAHDAIRLLGMYHWDHVFLDHDLGLSPMPHPGDGSMVVSFIVQKSVYAGRFRKTKFWIHSMNDERARFMVKALRDAGLKVTDAPEAWDRIEARKAG
jgi:CheY-like chemotaxis protein